jgi:hypothetical protein
MDSGRENEQRLSTNWPIKNRKIPHGFYLLRLKKIRLENSKQSKKIMGQSAIRQNADVGRFLAGSSSCTRAGEGEKYESLMLAQQAPRFG